VGVADELARLVAERDAGELDDEQFERKKADLLAHPELARATAPPEEHPAISPRRRTNRRRALVVAALIVLALVAWAIIGELSVGPARFHVAVTTITPHGPDAVEVTATLTNVGGKTGLGQCELVVTVPNADGSTAEITPPEPFNALTPVTPSHHESATAIVAIMAGHASYVTARDLAFTCQ
jgi:hypothetical protein